MLIGDDLGLDVARAVEKLLDKALATAESHRGLAHGGFVQIGHLVHLPGDLDAAPAAAKRGLDGDGQAVFAREGQHLVGAADGAWRAGHQGRAGLDGDAPRLHLVAQLLDGGGRRADPGQTGVDDSAGKASVL